MNRTQANTKSEMAPPHGTPSRMPEGGDFEGPISAADITQDTTHRFVTDTEKTTWNGKASTAVATQSANGLMSAADKKKLDGITDDILSLPGEGYEEVEIVDQVSMSASGVMVKVVPGFVLFIIKSVQFGGLKTAKFTLPGFIIGSVLTPAAFRAPGGTCTRYTYLQLPTRLINVRILCFQG